MYRIKTVFFAICLLGVAQLAMSQVPQGLTIKWGQKQKDQLRGSKYIATVGHDETGIYAFKSRVKSIYGGGGYAITLVHFDKQMNISKSHEFKLKTEGKRREFEFIADINDRLYLFTSFKNNKLKKNFLFAQSIDKATLAPNDDMKKVAEIDYSAATKENSGAFYYEYSRDKSRFMVYYDLPYSRREEESFGFHVFDENLDPLWAKEVTLPYRDKLFAVLDYRLSNAGNVYLLGKRYKDKVKDERKGKANYSYHVISYLSQGETVKEHSLAIEGKFLNDMNMIINDGESIVCGGFYSDEETDNAKGVYYLRLDEATSDIVVKEFNELSIEMMTEGWRKGEARNALAKDAKGKNVELEGYRLVDLIIKESGGAIFIGEQRKLHEGSRKTINNTYKNNDMYRYHELIVLNLSADGDIIWSSKIPKMQRSYNDGGAYLSYILAVVDDKFHFVFNDHINNMEGSGKKQKEFDFDKDSVVSMVTMDEEGNQKRVVLFTYKHEGVFPNTFKSQQLSDRSLVIIAERNLKQKFARITFD